MSGVRSPQQPPPKHQWRLHLKDTTPLNATELFALDTASTRTQEKLADAWRFMSPQQFALCDSSRTVKATGLSQQDIDDAIAGGKFEPCDPAFVHGPRLPPGVHGVNVFAVPEVKGRRRLITEPLLNAAVKASELPELVYPTRLGRRQGLRRAAYMLQVDFDAYYDSIPIDESLRNHFVFRKGLRYYRLRTLPTGARWSVAVAQAATDAITDIDTPIKIESMIDNILFSAELGQERQFVSAVRRVLERIRRVNLVTTPPREDLLSSTDEQLLEMAVQPCVFLGEEYSWFGQNRMVRNSVKTRAKIKLALRAPRFSHRSLASLISIIMFATHTTRLNPARCFGLMRLYRAVFVRVYNGSDWDSEHPPLHPTTRHALTTIASTLVRDDWWEIDGDRGGATYDNAQYDAVVFTDASVSGWGAVLKRRGHTTNTTYQQQWIHDIHTQANKSIAGQQQHQQQHTKHRFLARHSAHAEPMAVRLVLQRLVQEGIPDGAHIAVVTDHFAIVHAQKRENGFGGIGRGYALNKLYEYAYDLWYTRGIQVVFFYVKGEENPADQLSRHFGAEGSEVHHNIVVGESTSSFPPLSTFYSPLAENLPIKSSEYRRMVTARQRGDTPKK